MSKNVLERMEEIDAKPKIANFMVKQKQPYEFKKRYAEMTALKFAEECYICCNAQFTIMVEILTGFLKFNLLMKNYFCNIYIREI